MLAILAFSALLAFFGLALGFAAERLKTNDESLVERIDSVLPQTQCGQCLFPGCRPYAEAIARGEAEINQCPPGGDDVIASLAQLMGIESKPLNSDYGSQKAKGVAFIVEQECIGCVKCIEACPVDAILGSARMMHTVIAAECTGCELCVPACPVDCIVMQPFNDQLDERSTAPGKNAPPGNDSKHLAGVSTDNALNGQSAEMPCIRCGDCVTACPVNLLPQQLYWHCRADQKIEAETYGLFDCIECGRCESICPSQIPLVANYKTSKNAIAATRHDKQQAEAAKERYQARNERLAREQSERQARLRERKNALYKRIKPVTDKAGLRVTDSTQN